MNKMVLFLSDNQDGGGIAFNVKSLVYEFTKRKVNSKAVFINNGFLKAFIDTISLRFSLILYCTSGKSLLLGLLVSLFRCLLFKKTTVASIVYHPRFCDEKISGFRGLLRKALSCLPKGNVIYYCDEAKRSSGIIDNSEHSNIIGLCSYINNVETENFDYLSSVKRSDYVFHISTVGRQVDFKCGYLLQLIEYAKENNNILLSIVGYGPKNEMLIKHAEGKNNIIFHGKRTLGESKFIIEESDLFIGMGTTLVDATILGVPAIVAIESSNQGLTSGYFGDDNSISFGEFSCDKELLQLKDFLSEEIVNGKLRHESLGVNKEYSITSPGDKLLEYQDSLKHLKFICNISAMYYLSLAFGRKFIFPEKDYHE